MKIRIYGGRVGFGTEWEQEFDIDADTTEKEIDYLAGHMSADFMEYDLEDHADMYDYWYEWEILEGDWWYNNG